MEALRAVGGLVVELALLLVGLLATTALVVGLLALLAACMDQGRP